MATTRRTLGDRLNDAADGAITTLISISNGEVKGMEANARMGAAKVLLAKVVPDLRAVDLKVDPVKIKHTITFK